MPIDQVVPNQNSNEICFANGLSYKIKLNSNRSNHRLNCETHFSHCSIFNVSSRVRESRKCVVVANLNLNSSEKTEPSVTTKWIRNVKAALIGALVACSGVIVGSLPLNLTRAAVVSQVQAKESVETETEPKKLNQKQLQHKFNSVPVFCFTDINKKPILTEYQVPGAEKGVTQLVAPIFIGHKDAIKFADSNNIGAGKTVLEVMPLYRALRLSLGGPLKSGLREESGGDRLFVFQVIGDSECVAKAKDICKKRNLPEMPFGLPVFLIQGLTMEVKGKTVFPVFMSLDDLNNVWEQTRSNSPKESNIPRHVEVDVADAMALYMYLEDQAAPPTLASMQLFANTESLQWMQSVTASNQKK